MRTLALASLFSLVVAATAAAGSARVFLPDLLPATTMACIVPPENDARERDYSGSIFHRLAQLPEMAAFLRSFEDSRRNFAAEVSRTANVSPQLAGEIVNGRLGLALLNLGIGRDGKPAPEYLVALSLSSQPDRSAVFAAVMALLNRPDVVRQVLESQGIDPNIPIRTLAQEETISGYPPILRIGPAIRVAAVGNMIILYHGQGSDGIKKIFDSLSNPANALSRQTAFQAAYRGSEARPGMSFAYINVPRVMPLLDLLNLGPLSRIAESLGIASGQSIGLAGGYQGDGVKTNAFLYAPGGVQSGLVSALVPMDPNSPYGMEVYSQTIPGSADAFLAMRVNVGALVNELPYFLDAIGGATRPGGIAALMTNERILGVPVMDIVKAVGGDVLIRPHDGTQVLQLNNVDIPAFESIIARMEQNAGAKFSGLNVGGYRIRYFNRRSSILVPVAPAYCLLPSQQGGNRGIVYLASHPQALVSLIHEAASAQGVLAAAPDYRKATTGMGSGYSMFFYHKSEGAYRRVYNFFLPLAAVWASSSRFPVDTGLLPIASAISPAMFGCSVGMKYHQDGVSLSSYSPVGGGAIPVLLIDSLVISNPLVIGYVYTIAEKWLQAMPGW